MHLSSLSHFPKGLSLAGTFLGEMSVFVALVAFHVVLSVTFGTVLGQMPDLLAAIALLLGGFSGAVLGHVSRLLAVVASGATSVVVGSSVSVLSVNSF